MSIFKQLVFGLLLPAIVGGGIFTFAKVLTSKRARDQTEAQNNLPSKWLVGAALSVGYIVGYIGLEGLPPFPPGEGVHWLCYFALIGLILGVFWHLAPWGRLISKVVVSIIGPRLLLSSMFKYTLGTG